MGEVTPTELKTDAGTVVSSVSTAELTGTNVVLPGVVGPLPLATLTMTRATTTITTSPTAIQVNSPAGRPPRAGAFFFGAGRCFEAICFATMFLCDRGHPNVSGRTVIEPRREPDR